MKLRDWINKIDDMGMLCRVDAEVDWNLEASGIEVMLARVIGKRQWYALLLTNIKDYPGQTYLFHHMCGPIHRSWEGVNMMLNLPSDTPYPELCTYFNDTVSSPIPPTLVATGSCKENIRIGKDANLLDFAWPYVHAADGGRYITFGTFVSKALYSDWTNWGNYRGQIQSKNKIGFQLIGNNHGGYMYFQEYEPAGKPMPVAICFGGHIESLCLGGMKCPFGVSEVDYVGALVREPIQLVKCETNNLLVPADSEVVIEGEFRPYERMDEGPFVEYIGYLHGPRIPRPFMRVTGITWRNNPIIPCLAEGMPGTGCGSGPGSMGALLPILAYLQDPKVNLDGSLLPTKNGMMLSLKVPTGFPDPALGANLLDSIPVISDMNCYNVLGPDTDARDHEEILEAMFLKTHPNKVISTDGDQARMSSQIYVPPDDRRKGTSNRLWLNTCWPDHWTSIPEKVTWENSFPDEVRSQVVEKWKGLGFKDEIKVKE